MKKTLIFLGILGFTFIVYSITPLWGMTTVKVGTLTSANAAPFFIGKEKGFFEMEGINVELVIFKAAQPITVATASGDIDVGSAGLTAGLYNSISQGMKIAIVSDKGREWPGYRLCAILVNKEQSKAGVKTIKDLKGKRIGITQVGSTFHYMIGNILAKNGMSLNDVKIIPLGSVASMRDTIITNQIDAAFCVEPVCTSMEKSHADILLWVGDHLPYQVSGNYFGEKFMKNRAAAVSLLKGYIRSVRHFVDYVGPNNKGKPQYGEIMKIVSERTGEKIENVEVALSRSYFDRNGELYVEDIQKQLDWYHQNGFLPKKMSSSEVVDLSFWKEALQQLGK